MKAEEEKSAALALVGLESEVWAKLLSERRVAKAIVAFLEPLLKALPEKSKPQAAIDCLAQVKTSRTPAACLALGRELRPHDVERKWTREAVGLAESLHDGTAWFEGYLGEVRRLCRAAAHARNDFTARNLRLVVHIAQRYRGHSGVSFIDLIQEGNLGLMRGLERFDPSRAIKFSTYAGWWIKHHLLRYVQNAGRTVRVPVGVQLIRGQVQRTRWSHYLRNGVEPTAEEIAEATDIDLSDVERGLTIDTGPVFTLDALVDNSGETFLDRLTEEEDEEELDSELRELAAELLWTLPAKEKAILQHRFGFLGDERKLQEVGDMYSLSRERIRQLQDRALDKLRRSAERRGVELSQFL